ncbi:MAG: NUDIX hydrolase [Microthrixaceae bacterium]
MRDWVVGGALIESVDPVGVGTHVLLVENERRGGSRDWTTPGGVIDEGEEILEGLGREVREETGLEVVSWSGLLYEVLVDAPGLGWRLRVEVHRAVDVEGELRVGQDPDGIVVGADWTSRDDCPGLLRAGPAWVHEPLSEWLRDGFESPRRFDYEVGGSSMADLTVRRV